MTRPGEAMPEPAGYRVPDRKDLFGVLHLAPLPGTPFHRPGSLAQTVQAAVRAAVALRDGGADGALLQTADRVYSVKDEADPARVAAMTLCAARVAEAVGPGFALGVQIMRHAVQASLAVAKVAGARFVRADALVGATLSTHGWVRPDPLAIMTYRRALDAFDIRLIVDVDSMHYHWPDSQESAGGVAKRAMLAGADAVCIAHPDEATAVAKIADSRQRAPQAPVLVGGFLDHSNAVRLLAGADGAFVSGCLMDPSDGTRVQVDRVRRLADIMHGCAG